MRKLTSLLLVSALAVMHSAHSLERINSKDAHAHVGDYVEACGIVVSTKGFKKGVYLNFDKPYPNQTLVGVVWSDAVAGVEDSFGGLSNLRGKSICVEGVIKRYNGNLQISINNPDMVR